MLPDDRRMIHTFVVRRRKRCPSVNAVHRWGSASGRSAFVAGRTWI